MSDERPFDYPGMAPDSLITRSMRLDIGPYVGWDMFLVDVTFDDRRQNPFSVDIVTKYEGAIRNEFDALILRAIIKAMIVKLKSAEDKLDDLNDLAARYADYKPDKWFVDEYDQGKLTATHDAADDIRAILKDPPT